MAINRRICGGILSRVYSRKAWAYETLDFHRPKVSPLDMCLSPRSETKKSLFLNYADLDLAAPARFMFNDTACRLVLKKAMVSEADGILNVITSLTEPLGYMRGYTIVWHSCPACKDGVRYILAFGACVHRSGSWYAIQRTPATGVSDLSIDIQYQELRLLHARPFILGSCVLKCERFLLADTHFDVYKNLRSIHIEATKEQN